MRDVPTLPSKRQSRQDRRRFARVLGAWDPSSFIDAYDNADESNSDGGDSSDDSSVYSRDSNNPRIHSEHRHTFSKGGTRDSSDPRTHSKHHRTSSKDDERDSSGSRVRSEHHRVSSKDNTGDSSDLRIHPAHRQTSSKEGTGIFASDTQNVTSDDDIQHRRSSWADHRTNCESCAKLSDICSSRPSTLMASDSAAAWGSTCNFTQYSSTGTLAAESDASKRGGMWQELDHLMETAASAMQMESAEGTRVAERTPQTEDQLANSAATRIIRVRKPDGTIVEVRRKIRSAPMATAEATNMIEAMLAQEPYTCAESDASIYQRDSMGGEDTIYSENVGHGQHAEKGAKSGLVVREIERNDEDEDQERLERRRRGARVLLRRTSRLAQILIWTVTIVFPLFFITLGILTAIISGTPQPSKVGDGVAMASRIAVSVWPIVFAAIVAQSLRMYASFRAERGIPLMTLEQLIGSHSVGSAIKQPFVLWRFSWMSVLLLCLWSLSPLAGQALLYMSVDGSSSQNSTQLYSYLNMSGQSRVFDPTSNGPSYSSNVDSIFGASIFSGLDVQTAPKDPWNNTKIPILPDRVPNDAFGWIAVDDESLYSSLVGVPIANFSISPDSNFTVTEYKTTITLRSSYYAFECPTLLPGNFSQIQQIAHFQGVQLLNSSSQTLSLGLLAPHDKQPGQLLFVSKAPQQKTTHVYTTCNFTPSYVQSEVICAYDYCYVDRMRRDSDPDLPASQAPLADALTNMLKYFLDSGNPYAAANHPSPKEYFLKDASQANSFAGNLDLSAVSAAIFSQRLALLFNTYWQASIAPWAYTGNVPTANLDDPLLQQNATIITETAVYRANRAWLAVLLASGTILLVAAVAGAIWDARTVGPDIFGFASSLAHRNKYMRVPSGGSTIGGPARARQLRDVRVMLQDVRPGEEVGKIALGTVDENGGQRLQLGRMYK